ncbi:hypothetical protein L6164_007582 [Bauhinia variegata]|uniref:Uncharacterized protein n=1 Tax=Bauhinia variegata TaxID=167791 RepID=A0ACB9PD14_BAUVA|nr:hypothetical protein L6164_007582 [Bauhinia variegata]
MGILAQYFGCSAFASAAVAKSSSIIEDLCPRFSLAQLRKFTNFDPDREICGVWGKLYKCSIDGGSDHTIAIVPATPCNKNEQCCSASFGIPIWYLSLDFAMTRKMKPCSFMSTCPMEAPVTTFIAITGMATWNRSRGRKGLRFA